MDFVIAAANLRGFNYGLHGSTDPALFSKVLDEIVVPEFVPKSGVKIQTKDEEPVEPVAGPSAFSSSLLGEGH